MAIFNFGDIEIYYEVKGNHDAEKTIAFFNGVMASASSWDFYSEVFVNLGFRVVLHDFKGQLMSSKPNGPYTFEEHCQEVNALFETLGIKTVHLVGTSYGGEVAMKFALLYPEKVRSISIIDSVSETDALMRSFVDHWSALCDLKDGEKFFWGMLPSIYGKSYIVNRRDFLVKRAEAMKHIPESYFDGQKILYETFIREVDMTEAIIGIECPALVVCGEEDLLKSPKYSKIIAEKIKKSEMVIIPDCGHVAIFEKPETLKTILIGFILKQEI